MSERLYIVLDNFSPHLKRTVRDWARANRVTLVFTPTNASWLNRIECHFGAMKKFAMSNSDYSSHEELAAALQTYIRWRNANAADAKLVRVQKRYDFS